MNSRPGARRLRRLCIPPTPWPPPSRALGAGLPYSSSNPALSQEKKDECFAAGKAIRLLLEKDIKPGDIMTRKAFENAIVTIAGPRRQHQRGYFTSSPWPEA